MSTQTKEMVSRGPCAKRRVICTITYGGSPEEFVRGENDCANPQAVCPRLPGEGYEKCRSICHQAGHAEIQAVESAREQRIDLTGATAIVTGHYWICEPCGAALREAGVGQVIIVPSK
jgi:deoxycytidylate deaminase